MDHGGEAARSTELGMAGSVQGIEANYHSGTFDGQLGAVAAPARQLGPIGVVLVVVGPQLPDGVVWEHDNDGYYSVLQHHAGARRGVMLVELLGSGAVAVLVHNGDYTLQAPPGAQRGDVLVYVLPDGAGHGEAFVGLLPGEGVTAFDDYAYVYYSRQLRQGAGHGEMLTGWLPNGAGHGEEFPSGGGAVHHDYGYYVWQPRLGAGHAEVVVGLLPSGGVAVHDDYDYYVWQPRLYAGRGELLPDGVGVVFDGSGEFLPDPGTRGADGNDNRGVVSQHLRRILPFAGIGASSVAINGLVAGPGSPAAAFHLLVLLLGGLFLVILHVLRV